MNRRQMMGALGIASTALLAGCATQPGTTTGGGGTVTLSLAQIQAQVVAINNAIQASNTLYQISAAATSVQKQIAAASAQASAQAASAIMALSSNANLNALLQSFVNAVLQVLPLLAPVLGLNPAAAAAISLGVALLQAFMGQVALPVALPKPEVGVVLGPPPAPVAVPLPTRVP